MHPSHGTKDSHFCFVLEGMDAKADYSEVRRDISSISKCSLITSCVTNGVIKD